MMEIPFLKKKASLIIDVRTGLKVPMVD